jgi:RimJ/RimL family protein N-acetyltransferase
VIAAVTGRDVLVATKAAASHPQPAVCVPVGRPPIALLRPVVTAPGAAPRSDVRALTEWRSRFSRSFLTEFDASEQRTERWLSETVGPDDSRILFMVDDLDERTVGYIGLAFIDWEAGSAEADAVVRGVAGERGLYTPVLHAIWRWARTALGLTTLRVRVRSDNPSVSFYERAGFRETHRVPLRREQHADGAAWVEDPSLAGAELTLVHMELESDAG